MAACMQLARLVLYLVHESLDRTARRMPLAPGALAAFAAVTRRLLPPALLHLGAAGLHCAALGTLGEEPVAPPGPDRPLVFSELLLMSHGCVTQLHALLQLHATLRREETGAEAGLPEVALAALEAALPTLFVALAHVRRRCERRPATDAVVRQQCAEFEAEAIDALLAARRICGRDDGDDVQKLNTVGVSDASLECVAATVLEGAKSVAE